MVMDAINSILALLLLIAAGYYITGKSWFGSTGANLISKLTMQLIIPCYMFYNVLDTCPTRADLKNMLLSTPVPMGIILLNLAMGLAAAKLLHIDRFRQGVFVNAMAFSNTTIIGFPVVENIFGAQALPTAMIYYMGNTILFWTIGVYMIQRSSNTEEKHTFTVAQRIKKLLPPPMLGLLLGMAVVALDLPLPAFFQQGMSMMKNATTPMCMLFIGSIIQQSGLKSLYPTRDMMSIVLVRFLLVPVMAFGICMILPYDLLTKQVFFILATMPAMTQLGIMAKECGSDYEFAAAVITVTTTLSMAAIPIYVYFVSFL